MSITFDRNQWAVILGGSSGFGLATAQKLSRHGMSVAIVHRDRRGAMKRIDPAFDAIRESGVGFVSFNADALSEDGRRKVLDSLTEKLGEHGRVRMMMHSIAFGNLKPVAPVAPRLAEAAADTRSRLAEKLGISAEALADAVNEVFDSDEDADALAALANPPAYGGALLEDEDFVRTIYSMGTSLSSWTQDVFKRKLFADDARIVGMTSEGNEVAWRGYAAVAAAKVSLESLSRAIALEFAPYGLRSNIVQAGVTDTAALRLIPGSGHMKAGARLRNPFGRLTTAADVADFICLLCTDEAHWVNGTIIRVDGGEHIAG